MFLLAAAAGYSTQVFSGVSTLKSPASSAPPSGQLTAPGTTILSNVNGQTEIHIRYSDPVIFLRELAQLGVSKSLVDPDILGRLLGWRPNLRQEQGQKSFRAEVSQSASRSNVKLGSLFFVPGDLARQRGVLRIYLYSDAYCVRMEDAKNAFEQAGRLYRPPHAKPRPTPAAVFGAVFQTGNRTRIVLDFEYNECVQSIHVLKNID